MVAVDAMGAGIPMLKALAGASCCGCFKYAVGVLASWCKVVREGMNRFEEGGMDREGRNMGIL